MGGIHPRLKRPVGRRLAVAAVNLVPRYRSISSLKGQTARTGPTLSGCTYQPATPNGAAGGGRLVLRFNQSLLGTEGLALRPYESNMAKWAWRFDSSHTVLTKQDSVGLMVCTANGTAPYNPRQPPQGNATTCACQSWAAFVDNRTAHAQPILYCETGPGWKPSAEEFPLANRKPARVQSNPFAAQWTSVPLVAAAGGTVGRTETETGAVAVGADLSVLAGATPLAVRLAWPLFAGRVSGGDDGCCPTLATFKGLSACVPGNCPLYSSASELPANPFFAAIAASRCACLPPQDCGN